MGNPRAVNFLTKTLMEPAEKSNWEWKGRVRMFYKAAAAAAAGDKSEEVQQELEEGLRYYLARLEEDAPWKDAPRKGREDSGFEPKADWVLERRR